MAKVQKKFKKAVEKHDQDLRIEVRSVWKKKKKKKERKNEEKKSVGVVEI